MSCIVLDRCRIGPPPSQQPAKFPLTFFDIEWLSSIPMEQVMLYQFPCSKTHFLETIVPNLKNSLSNTLKHYLPFAGNIIFPTNSGMPYIQFLPGDSVDVTLAEYCNSDSITMMSYLTGNQPREVDKFYPLVPALPGTRTKVGNFAVQLTLFPGAGISVGWATHHAAGDVSSVVAFLKAWGLITRLGEEGYLAASEHLPFHDRSAIKDPITSLGPGYSLSDHYWNQMKNNFQNGYSNKPPPRENSDHVRATFVLSGEQIKNLKNLVLSMKPTLTHISSFVVSCAYVWTCMRRMSSEEEEELEENVIFPMDARARLHSPVPDMYFGNCLVPGMVAFKLPNQYSDHERMALCAELIGEFIKTSTEKGPAIFRDADHWLDGQGVTTTTKRRILAVVASPKFNIYDVDFGWGTPTKFEVLCTDIKGNMSLSRSRELDGGLEIGLSMTKADMNAFVLLFSNGLEGINLTRTRPMNISRL